CSNLVCREFFTLDMVEESNSKTLKPATFESLTTLESSKRYNAQLRGEQRLQPNLTHCAINTKFEVEAKMPSVVNPS
ncbi:hypothetical protein, partial [Vibrio sp. S9_S30]|uniref:hypothetical protein n=1 Tax=Vibrio sp. S9_S30 TaxID=2720226 RepID=UPI001EEF614C